jgi:APA family basic amino acid/polyamine antiporter
MSELKRTLGVFGAASMSIGSIIGAGIFVLIGVASGIGGPGVITSFLVAGITALFTALSAAELASFITEAGGSYVYTQKAFGNFLGFVVGWIRSFDYIVGAGAISLGFAGYFCSFCGIPSERGTMIVIAVGLPLLFMLINIRGISEASGVTSILVILKITALMLFIIIGGFFLFLEEDFSNYYPFFPNGIGGMLSGASIVFFAFVGFETIWSEPQKVYNQLRNFPI